MTNTNTELRTQLVKLLTGEQAHLTFADAIAELPDTAINLKPANVPYTFWHLVEHLRITQLDILNYLTNADYEEREWPAEYWPAPDAEATREQWDQSVQQFAADLETLIAMAREEAVDLFAVVPSHPEHTVLRELMIIGNHNSYHIGELAILRQVTGTWGPSHT